MILYKKYPMIFEEKNYEIRVLYDDTTINVVSFLNNYVRGHNIPQCGVRRIPHLILLFSVMIFN